MRKGEAVLHDTEINHVGGGGGGTNYIFDRQRIWPNSRVFYLVTNHHLNTAYGCGRAGLMVDGIQVSDMLFLRSLPSRTFWKVDVHQIPIVLEKSDLCQSET